MAIASTLLLSLALLQPAQSPSGVPDLDVEALASGPFSSMHMLMEKTIFGVDVLTIDVRFDRATQERFRTLAGSPPLSSQAIDRIAAAAVDAGEVWASIAFRRRVSLSQWLDGVGDSLGRASRAGLIQEQTYRELMANLPRWFAAVAERGFQAGDRILYRGYPDRLRTLLVTPEGRVLVNHVGEGAAPRRTLLAGYFAPGSDTREPLVRSLLP
jgi:hypothetical protein